MYSKDAVTYLGRTNARPPYRTFGIKQADRPHMYLIGKTGVGKTTLFEGMALQDMLRGRGLCVLDPHGDLVARLAASVPPDRAGDLIYFDAPNPNQPFGYNPLRKVSPDRVPLVASGLLAAFEKIWSGRDWGRRMEHVLRNSLLALLEHGDATLADILRLFTDDTYRKSVAGQLTNAQVRTFWLSEFVRYQPRYRQDMIAPVQSKLGALLSDPRLYRIFTAPKIDIRLREAMDRKKIVLVNLSIGGLGEMTSSYLGAVLVCGINLAAFSRIDIPEHERQDFVLYMDEFQHYLSLAVANGVAELRKTRTAIVAANQHLAQLSDDVRSAVLANAGTVISFRIGPEDATLIGKYFAPVFTPEDLMNLPNHDFYIRLQIDGAPSRPFSATTLTPDEIREHLRRVQ